MKTYTQPQTEIVKISTADVLTASGTPTYVESTNTIKNQIIW